MTKIEVGEYVRTKQGYIAKVEDIGENIIMCDSDIYSDYEIAPVLVGEQMKLITKHSFNIIDLIEVGDIVNKEKVLRTYKDKQQQYIVLETRNIFSSQYKDIKTIVTKEQFNSVMYKVGDIE